MEKATLSNQNHWEKETMPSGSSGESWRPCWHYLRQAVHSSFLTHSWDISNHNCEWHPAGPFWDQVPLYKCPILCLEAAELPLTSTETQPALLPSELLFHGRPIYKVFNRTQFRLSEYHCVYSKLQYFRKPAKDRQG